jgi:hypothetical protein
MASIINGSDNFNTNSVSFGNAQTFTSSGTFNVPLGVSRVKVTVIGAAGSGGNGAGGVCVEVAGGGGGAGGCVIDYVAVTAGGTATVTVGTNGGTRTSSFAGTTTITATGGSNGTNATGSPGTRGASGAFTKFGLTVYLEGDRRASNAVNTIPQINLVSSVFTITQTEGFTNGHGYGVSGMIRSIVAGNNARHTPLGYGSGGGGGSSAALAAGGTGTNGLVIVEW